MVQGHQFNKIELSEGDVIIGSPPCQRFSQANYYSRDYDDSLVKRFMEIVEQVNQSIGFGKML